jgi:desampylase
MTTVRASLSESVKQALVRRARHAYPHEQCGFIMNSADPDTEQFVFEVPNVSAAPRHYWRMDPEYQRLAMLDEESVFGIYHTHPNGPDGPSTADIKYAPPNMRAFVATINGVFEYYPQAG